MAIAKLDYVIRMPLKLFSEQKRTVNTSIFGFTKTPHRQDYDVMFYNLEDDGFFSIQHKGRVDRAGQWPEIQKTIVDAVLNMKDIPDLCERRKIYNNGILNPSGIRIGRNNGHELVKISTLFRIEKGTLASESNIEGDYPFITASEEWKTHIEYSHDTEAIIYAVGAAGSLGRSHYIKGKFTASSLCLILTNKHNSKYPIDMQFYNCYFASIKKKIVSDLAEGTSKLIISTEMFSDYYIDYIPYDKQKEFVNKELKEFLQLKAQYSQAEAHMSEVISKLA